MFSEPFCPPLDSGGVGSEALEQLWPEPKGYRLQGYINLFDCVYIDEKNGKAVVAHKPHPTQSLRPLGDRRRLETQGIKAAKAVTDDAKVGAVGLPHAFRRRVVGKQDPWA